MLLLVVGGAKSGKSMLAQCLCRALAGEGGRMVYLATLDPCDGEARQRIARHRRDRDGWGFKTREFLLANGATRLVDRPEEICC